MYFSLLLLHRLFSLEHVFTYIISLIQQGNYNWSLIKVSTRIIQKNIKSSSKQYVRKAFKVWTTGQYFPRIINQWFLVYRIRENNCPLWLLTRVIASSNEMFYLSQQNNFSGWKATCYIKQEFFLQFLFFETYLIYVAVTLKSCTPNKKYVF